MRALLTAFMTSLILATSASAQVGVGRFYEDGRFVLFHFGTTSTTAVTATGVNLAKTMASTAYTDVTANVVNIGFDHMMPIGAQVLGMRCVLAGQTGWEAGDSIKLTAQSVIADSEALITGASVTLEFLEINGTPETVLLSTPYTFAAAGTLRVVVEAYTDQNGANNTAVAGCDVIARIF